MEKLNLMFSYSSTLDEKTRNSFRVDLLRDVKTVEKVYLKRSGLEAAAEELIKR